MHIPYVEGIDSPKADEASDEGDGNAAVDRTSGDATGKGCATGSDWSKMVNK